MGNFASPVWLVLVPLLMQLLGLTGIVVTDKYIKKNHRQVMLFNILLMLSLVVQNYAETLLSVAGDVVFPRLLVSIYGYTVRPVILLLFLYVITAHRHYIFGWVLVGINALIYLTALFSDISFTIDANNHFQRGPLGYTCHIISAILLLWLVQTMLAEFSDLEGVHFWVPMIIAFMLVSSVVVDGFFVTDVFSVSFLTMAIVSSSLFFYIWLHQRFVWQHEEDLKAQQRIKIMLSQIQPHFMYNTLATIQGLCLKDPETAAKTTERFGTYFRQNIASLKLDQISVEEELEHTRVYVEIEQLRFPNIDVEYDIREKGFYVPALSIQPMVENAIRHGLHTMREGKVTISVSKGRTGFEIRITDNGIGFDPVILKEAEAQDRHIGIRNVRGRVENLCHGSLVIESEEGRGTMVLMMLPFENAIAQKNQREEKNDNHMHR